MSKTIIRKTAIHMKRSTTKRELTKEKKVMKLLSTAIMSGMKELNINLKISQIKKDTTRKKEIKRTKENREKEDRRKKDITRKKN